MRAKRVCSIGWLKMDKTDTATTIGGYTLIDDKYHIVYKVILPKEFSYDAAYFTYDGRFVIEIARLTG